MYYVSILLDVLCLVHVTRTGRYRVWPYIIIGIPMLGALAYLGIEMLPEMLRSRHGRHLTDRAVRKVAPRRTLKRHADRLEIADTVQNRIRLAEETMRLGRFEEAASIYRSSLEGVYADDIALLMGLARATFCCGMHAETLDSLERLRTAHPDYASNEAHLIYARSLEGLGRTDEALAESAVVVDRHPGEEARCRYAMLLQRVGREDEAPAMFAEIVKRARRAARHYVRVEKDWIEIAKRNGTVS